MAAARDYINDNIRRTEILARLINKEPLTVFDLCIEYNVSESTINRDFKYLRSEGLTTYSRKKILSIGSTPDSNKLAGYLSEYLAFKLSSQLLYDKLEALSKAGNSNFFQILTLTAKAVEEHQYLHFRYERITDNIENEYTVKPIELKVNDFNWSLIAVKEGEDVEKLFYLSRIKEIQLTGEIFPKGDEKSLETLYDIVLKFHPDCRNGIYSKIWFPDFKLEEDEKGFITLKTRTSINKRLASWCLRWQNNITVVEPKKLKEKIREMTDLFYSSNKF
jgi:predicted DNA-binding transcriptional regulator YafY